MTGTAAPTFCSDCGAKLEPQFRFCGSCGRSLDAAASPGARGRMTVVDDMSELVAKARRGAAGDTPVQPEFREHREPPPAAPPPYRPVAPEHHAPPSPPAYAYSPPPPPAVYNPPLAYGAPVVVAQSTSTNGFAIASLVLGIVWLYGLGSLLAVIFGAVAISQIRRMEGRQTGEGMAIAGLVLGIVGLVLVLALIIVGISLA